MRGLCFGQMLQWENVACVHNDNQLLDISVWGLLVKTELRRLTDQSAFGLKKRHLRLISSCENAMWLRTSVAQTRNYRHAPF